VKFGICRCPLVTPDDFLVPSYPGGVSGEMRVWRYDHQCALI
jgi:hypothetical protein